MTLPNSLTLAPQLAQAPTGSGDLTLLMIVLMFALFYFAMLRPQQRKDKERRKQIEELRAGARVIFAGGILGTIVEAKQATFRIEVADGVILEVARGAVNRILKEGEAASLDETR